MGLLDQTINIMGQQSINEELKQATVVIQPKVGHLGALDLKASNDAILEGEKAAQLKIRAIQSAIDQFKNHLLPFSHHLGPNSKVIFYSALPSSATVKVQSCISIAPFL